MRKRSFHSQLFRREIKSSEKDFAALVKAELLWRIYKMEKENCDCMLCGQELKKYKDYFEKIIEEEKRRVKLL